MSFGFYLFKISFLHIIEEVLWVKDLNSFYIHFHDLASTRFKLKLNWEGTFACP